MLKKVVIGLSLLIGLYYRLYVSRIIQYALKSCMATLCCMLLSVSNYLINPVRILIDKCQTIHTLYESNQRLKLINKQLEQELIKARSVVYEADITQPLVEFAKRYDCDLIGAHVIGRTLSNHYQILMLNKGSVHGITKDMIGIWYNYCIGKIYEVHPYSSILLLISDARCMVPCVSTTSRAHGMARGLNKQGVCAFDYVEHTNDLENGMPIITSGEGTLFAQGFGIGQLSGVTKRSLYYEAYIELAYKPQDIQYCYLGSRNMIENGHHIQK